MKPYDKPATPITSIKGYEGGIDYKRISSTMPYMYTDDPERVELVADECIVDQIVDWFGLDIRMTEIANSPGKVRVELTVSPNAMEHWALQYLNYVEVTKPESLRERIKRSLDSGREKYCN